MNESKGNGLLWSKWMESAADMWVTAAQSWGNKPCAPPGFSGADEWIQKSFEIYQSFLPSWTDAIKSFREGESGQPPFDMARAFMRMMGPDGFGYEISQWLWNRGTETGQSFERLHQETLSIWMSIYETALKPLLTMPHVGLTRVYQEKITRLADKFHSYQTAVSEFQMLFSVPVEKSFAKMREEVEKLRKKGESADDFNAYYGTWIKVLENQYMSLFRSDEYHVALSRLMEETAAFRVSGNDVLEEFLGFLPIPTNREMDDVYKELYSLKKQNKETIKKITKIETMLSKRDVK